MIIFIVELPYFMRFDKKHLSNTILLGLYKALLKPRLVEERMLLQIRQGKMSKTEIAYQLGYRDANSFYRVHKEWTKSGQADD